MSRNQIRSMPLDDLLSYLFGRAHTRELALQLACVRDERGGRAGHVGGGR